MKTRREFLAAAAIAPLLRAVPLADFKLGVTTDEINEDLAAALRFLGEFNLKWAELRSVWGMYAEKQPIPKIKEAKALLDEHGIKASILSTSFFKVPLPPEGSPIIENQWKLLEEAMDRAEILGVRKLRTFAFTYKASETPDPGSLFQNLRTRRRVRAPSPQTRIRFSGRKCRWKLRLDGSRLRAIARERKRSGP